MGDDLVIRFRVLGPLEAELDGERLSLGGPQQRLTLALLLADFGRPVSVENLIDSIWGDAPPATARKTLQVYVSHLRGILGDDCIESDGGGYRIVKGSLDAVEFEALCNRGWAEMAEDPRTGGDLLAEALGMWMGSPYADFEDNQKLLAEAAQLEEMRISALESRLDADLSAGSDASLIGELETLVRDHPFRERFRGQLMLALYRAGRQAEALRVFRKTRDLLIEELGIEPGPELWALEQQILDQDPSLLEGDKTIERPHIRAIKSYELREAVGDGPSGRVYRAFDRGTSRRVAVKIVGRDIASQPQYISTFEPALQLLAKLDHPHILGPLDYWRDAEGAYLVMPWMDGGSLKAALSDSRPWAPGPALRLIDEIGGALNYAHRHGVVHGSVKPNNILFDEEGTAYLADFPVVVARNGSYVAPEVADGESPTPRSDIYALGLIIHELFTGTLPEQGESASRLLSSEIQHVIRQATSADPSHRFDRVDELQRAIRRAAGADVVGVADESRDSSTRPRNPYKGLRAFQETDAQDFYGREDLIELTLEKIEDHRLVAVVGPSGSGKSSLVKAGVVPRLRGQTLVTEMFPGNYPFEELETALRRVAVEWPERGVITDLTDDSRGLLRVAKQILPDDDSQLVLVIDQFEELFSLLNDSETRSLFLESLTNVATDAHSRVRVVVTLRADFFDRPLEYSEFGSLLEAAVVPVTNPSRQELAAAVAQPARGVGIEIEPGLVSEIVSDFGDQPGGLPLLQFTLCDMVLRGDGQEVTAADYEQRRGIGGAIGARAEQVYLDQPPQGRQAVEQAILRMVRVGEEGAYTRQRVRRAELAALDVNQATLSQALQAFAVPRLLTFDRDPITRGATVEVAHEALLDEWPRLRDWIDHQREDLVTRRRLDVALDEWKHSGEDDGYLPTGSRLTQFDDWATETRLALSADERGFLQAAVERESQREASAGRRRRWIMAGFGMAAVVASVFALVALRSADTARAEALAAASIEQLDQDPERSVLLALQSLAIAETPNGLTALHQALQDHRTLWEAPPGCPEEERIQATRCGPGPQGFLHPDGRHVLTSTVFGRMSYWDTQSDSREPLWTTELPYSNFRPWIDVEENLLIVPRSDLELNDSVSGQTRGLYTIDLDNGEGVDVERLEGCVQPTSYPRPSDAVNEPALVMFRYPVAEADPTRCDLSAEFRMVVKHPAEDEPVALDVPDAVWRTPDTYLDIYADGRWFTISGSGVGAFLIDTTTGEVVKSYPEANRATLSFDGERILLYKGWLDGNERVELRDIDSDEVEVTVPGKFEWIRFTPDQNFLVGLEIGSAAVRVFDPATGELVRELVGPDIPPFILRFDSSSRRALVNYGLALRLWNLSGAVSEVEAPVSRVIESDESRDRAGVTVGGGLMFVPGYVEGRIGYAVYDLDGELVRQSTAGRGYMSPDGSLIVETPVLEQGAETPSGARGLRLGSPRLVDARTGRVIQELPSTCSSFAFGINGLEAGPDCNEDDVFLDITDVEFSDDLAILAVDSISTKPTVFDLTTNEMIFHDDVVEDEDERPRVHQPIALSPDGSIVAYEVAGADFPARFKAVDVRSGDTIALGDSLDMFKTLFSDDGARLYIADHSANVIAYETDTWTEVLRFERGQGEAIADVAVSGDLMATAGTDDVVRVWDVETGGILFEVPVDLTPRNAEFLDESHILVTTVEGEVLVFTLDPEELKSIAYDRLTRGFTEEECVTYEIDPCPTLREMRDTT